MDWAQLIIALVGGGGVVGIAVKIQQLIQERRAGELQEESTAIATWQAIADKHAQEAAEADWELRWYRSAYATLWAAYVTLPPPDKPGYPPAPPEPPH
ncbi:hypothetical protein [Brevibacterium otitidis]|uniref:Minor tail protein n=1 Tax=Brevibacterium otitidis TaxID=53364 RepID=A0ABV5X108_9MICO